MHGLTFPGAVEESQEFFDRDGPMAKIHAALQSRAGRTVVILGGRLVGKTSLLNVVAQWAEHQASFVVVRLAHAGSREELAAEIVHGIHEKVDPDGSTTDERFDHDGRFTFSTVARFVRTVQDLADRAPGSRFLLCIDEFDSLLQGCSDDEAGRILDLVLFLTEHAKLPIRFLFTISQVPERVRLSYSSPFLNQSTIVELRPWSATESREFTEWLLGDRLELDETAQGVLFRAAGGHPYFTKAVLQALLDAHRTSPAGVHPSPVDAMDAAVQTAGRSREVAVALANIADVHLSSKAILLLDRAAINSAGLGRRDIRDLGPSDGVLETLTENGFLSSDGRGYSLRLGLWRQWRAARLEGGRAAHGGPVAGLGQAFQRLIGGKAVKPALLSLLAVMLLTAVLGTVFFLPSASITAGDCTGTGSGLRARVSYPSYVSSGDEQRLQVKVTNDSSSVQPVVGSAVVNFPSAQSARMNVTTDNAISFDNLSPGEQQTLVVAFTYAQPGRLLPDTGSRVPVELRMSAAGTSCPTKRWSMTVAPVPHLRDLRKAIFGLIGLVGIPLLVDWFGRRLGGRRRIHAHDQDDAAESGSTAHRR